MQFWNESASDQYGYVDWPCFLFLSIWSTECGMIQHGRELGWHQHHQAIQRRELLLAFEPALRQQGDDLGQRTEVDITKHNQHQPSNKVYETLSLHHSAGSQEKAQSKKLVAWKENISSMPIELNAKRNEYQPSREVHNTQTLTTSQCIVHSRAGLQEKSTNHWIWLEQQTNRAHHPCQ